METGTRVDDAACAVVEAVAASLEPRRADATGTSSRGDMPEVGVADADELLLRGEEALGRCLREAEEKAAQAIVA